MVDELIPLSDTPNDLLAEIAETLHRSSVALIKILVDTNGQIKYRHIGSGILVSIGNVHGILTVHHVTRELDGPCVLGLTVRREGQEDTFNIDKIYLNIIDIAIPTTEEYGPDLSFIVLPPSKIGTIKMAKFFNPLLFDKEYILQEKEPIDGIWCICGVPEIMTKEEHSEVFDNMLAFHDFCGFGGIPTHYHKDGFDYTEVTIDYKQDTNIPIKFNGVSGGGLWRVLPDVKTKSFKHYLYGVAFYQSALEESQRFIRCHGLNGIYEHTIKKVQDIYK